MNATNIQAKTDVAAGAELKILTSAPLTETRTNTTETTSPLLPTRKQRISHGLVIAVVLLTTGAAGFYWWNYTHTWVSTNNAYVAGHIHTVSTRIAGNVTKVLVSDNQHVEAGDVLAQLEVNDLNVQREKAGAALSQANAQLAQIHAQVTRDEAVASKSQSDFDRADKLSHDTNAVLSRQEFEDAKAALDVARASLNATKASVLAAEAQVKAATAQLADVELQLSYTEIVAPAAGRVGRKNIEVGNRVQPGQSLLAIVQSQVWITANFKETEIAHLKPGQPVTVTVDGFPGHQFSGRIESISPASGAQFALLPPDNATGNFTKIVQRVPVKIIFDEACVRDLSGKVVPGMSVNAKVRIRS